MRKEFVLPDIGEGIVECELVEWLVKEGDQIQEDQPVADVMTDKALVQIPAVYAGIVAELHYKVGEIAKVGQPLFAVDTDPDTGVDPKQGTGTDELSNTEPAAETPAIATPTFSRSEELQQTVAAEIPRRKKAVASPAVRRVARELGVELADVPGSGDKGRIYKDDVMAFARREVSRGPVISRETPKVDAESRIEPLRGVRAAMAEQMQRAASEIPHFTLSDEMDLTELMQLRTQLKAEGDLPKLTVLPFMLKALSIALGEFPLLNSCLHMQRREIEYLAHHHIGIAVDTPHGLMVPVLRHVEQLSILDIAEQLQPLIAQAREGRLSRQHLSGGTFTVSNIGAIGGTTAMPVINHPQSAILAIGAVRTLPRFDEAGEVQARQICHLSWSADHRHIDGATLTRFSNRFIQLLQQPANLLINMR